MLKNSSTYSVFEKPGQDFYFKTVPIPDLKEGEILVRNTYCALCRSDLNTYIGKRTEKSPTILGHEIIGRIKEFGPNAPQTDLRGTNLKIGDRITWAIYSSNPESHYSQIGIPQKAPDLFKYGHEQITETSNLHGGLSEYTILRKNTPLITVSNEVPDPVAALINCSVATVAGALRLAGNLDEKTILINGTGMLGIIACAMVKENGAKKVIAADSNRSRADLARKFGADISISGGDKETILHDLNTIETHSASEVEVVLEFSGNPESMENTLQILNIGGVAIWVGATFPQRDVSVNAEHIIRNLLTIKGLHNYNEQDLLFSVNFIEQNHSTYDFNGLVFDKFTLNNLNEAFNYAIEKSPFRVGINLTSKFKI
jgi:putative phosphonate catabolism associated alcohol dehydrogenase